MFRGDAVIPERKVLRARTVEGGGAHPGAGARAGAGVEAGGDARTGQRAPDAPIRILIADDHEVVRRGVKALLESQQGWQVCGEASTGREAVQMAEQLAPDLVVLDVSMKEMNGIEAARQIRKQVPRAELLMLTIHDSEEVVREVLSAGAHGYVLKSDAGRDLVSAIRALREKKPYVSPSVGHFVLGGYLQAARGDAVSERPPGPRLSPREREVLQLLAEGNSNKEVASALGVSLSTAETHRKNILRKLDLHSMSELVRYAVRHNIVEP